jgi:hypothetical protein
MQKECPEARSTRENGAFFKVNEASARRCFKRVVMVKALTYYMQKECPEARGTWENWAR